MNKIFANVLFDSGVNPSFVAGDLLSAFVLHQNSWRLCNVSKRPKSNYYFTPAVQGLWVGVRRANVLRHTDSHPDVQFRRHIGTVLIGQVSHQH